MSINMNKQKVASLSGATQSVSVVKNSPAKAGDTGWTPRSGRCLREGHDNPLQYSCLENPTDRGPWRATVHGVAKSQTQLIRHVIWIGEKGHLRFIVFLQNEKGDYCLEKKAMEGREVQWQCVLPWEQSAFPTSLSDSDILYQVVGFDFNRYVKISWVPDNCTRFWSPMIM